MATEMINLKLESNFLKDIDELVKKQNYHSRTEFIRAALRKEVEEERLKQIKANLSRKVISEEESAKFAEVLLKLKGSLRGKAKMTDEEFEKMRDKLFDEVAKTIK